MVFTLNTTVFAEEVAVDSVDDAVEATVDAVDEVADEATVDDATTDATTTGYVGHLKYTNDGTKSVINAEITYSADPNVKKNAKENVAKITGVDKPVSWNNIYKNFGGYSYSNPVDPDTLNDGDGGTVLIDAVLGGSNEADTNLINDKTLGVSNNGAKVGDDIYEGYTEKVGNKLNGRNYAAYKVIDLGDDSHYLFVGYGDGASEVEGYEGFVPVYEYDGRQIDFNKSGKYKSTASKKEALDVAAALVEYKDGTVTEIPGVTVTGVKFDTKALKDCNKIATVSGQQNTHKWEYEVLGNDGKPKKHENADKSDDTRDAYKMTGSALGTFTIKVKVNGKDIDKTVKKAITDKLKDEKFTFAISQHVVNAWTNETLAGIFTDYEKNDAGELVPSGKIKVSTNNVYKNTQTLFNETEDSDGWTFDDFEMTKFDQTKGKADLALRVVTDNGKERKIATVKLKAGTDYDLADGSLAESVKVLEFKGNFVYADPMYTDTEEYDNNGDLTSRNVAPFGYKWAFRQTPEKDGKKQKTFRIGYYKGTQDGFVYSVDETAVDSVEEAF